MARTRSIKPAFFTNEELAMAEFASGLPLRVAFAGLWGQADREGRFAWQPGRLKLGILPFDTLDMGAVLDALAGAGFIRRYVVGAFAYGVIPTFKAHQHVHKEEAASVIPEPPAVDTSQRNAQHRSSATPTPPDGGGDTTQERLVAGSQLLVARSLVSGAGSQENSPAAARAKQQALMAEVRSDSAAADFLDEFEWAFRSSQFPESLASEFRSLMAGFNMPDGRSAPLPIIGQALRDMRVNRKALESQTLRIYAAKLLAPRRVTTAGASTAEDLATMAEEAKARIPMGAQRAAR